MTILKKIAARQHEVTRDYLLVLDKHLLDIVEGRTTQMYEIRDVAKVCISIPSI